jgi:hypothetical protein
MLKSGVFLGFVSKSTKAAIKRLPPSAEELLQLRADAFRSYASDGMKASVPTTFPMTDRESKADL